MKQINLDQTISEADLIEKIMSEKNPFNIFDFLFYPCLTKDEIYPDKFIFAMGLDRKCLGFENDKKPGDFDLIIIPIKKDKILIDYVGVLEIKVSRPKLSKLSKHSNSSGYEQVLGLVEDDFPFVGLMHLIIPEKENADYYTNELYETKFSGLDGYNGTDLTERQLGRFKKMGLPTEIGYCACVIYEYETFTSNSMGSFEFCKKREFNYLKLAARIHYALYEFKEEFYIYKFR